MGCQQGLSFSRRGHWAPRTLGVSLPGDPGRSCEASNAPAFKATQHHFCRVVCTGAGSGGEDYTGMTTRKWVSLGPCCHRDRSPELLPETQIRASAVYTC